MSTRLWLFYGKILYLPSYGVKENGTFKEKMFFLIFSLFIPQKVWYNKKE